MPRFRTPSPVRVIACAFAAALWGCATEYRVQVYAPRFDGVRTTVMEGNVLASGSLLGAADLELNVERVDSLQGAPHFAFRVRLESDGPAIHATAPLTLLVDGDSLSLPRDTTTRLARYDQVRVEEARYPVATGDLRRLATAAAVRLRIRVGSWREERHVYPRNLENIRRFLTDHLPADSIG